VRDTTYALMVVLRSAKPGVIHAAQLAG